jgi:hypothetical protein
MRKISQGKAFSTDGLSSTKGVWVIFVPVCLLRAGVMPSHRAPIIPWNASSEIIKEGTAGKRCYDIFN